MTATALQSRSIVLRVERGWLDLHPVVRWGTFVGLALGLLVLRRPESVFRAAFFYEDGQVFYVGAYYGGLLEQLTRAYAGYLNVLPRIAGALEWTVPVLYAPLVGNLIALGMVALLAAYVASDRLANVFPDRRIRILLAVLLLLLPGSWETLGSITLIQWYVAIFLVLASIAAPPSRRSFEALEAVAVAGASLTGPFAILFAPLYWVRAASQRDRWSMVLAVIVTAGAAIQLAVLAGSGERSAAVPGVVVAADLTYRLWATMLGGLWVSGLSQLDLDPRFVAAATAVLLATLVAAWMTVPRTPRLAFGYAAVIVLASTIADQPHGFPDSPYLAGRYFLVPAFCVAIAVASLPAVVGRLGRGMTVAGLAVAGLFVVGIIGDARLPAHPDYGWAQRSACIGGPAPCKVPVEFPNAWTIHWPGSSNAYVQPGTEGVRSDP